MIYVKDSYVPSMLRRDESRSRVLPLAKTLSLKGISPSTQMDSSRLVSSNNSLALSSRKMVWQPISVVVTPLATLQVDVSMKVNPLEARK